MSTFDYIDRLKVARVAMAMANVDCMLVTNEVNVRYLSGFSGDSTALFLTPDQVKLISDGRYSTQIRDQCPGWDVKIRPPEQPMHEAIAQVVTQSDGPVGFEAANMTVETHRDLQRSIEQSEKVFTGPLVPVGKWLDASRQCKDDAEISMITRAAKIAEEAFVETMKEFDPNETERQLAWRLDGNMRRLGAERPSFDIIVASGPAAALPHYHPQDVRIGDHSVLLIDWGAVVSGYASDMTRTLWVSNDGKISAPSTDHIGTDQISATPAAFGEDLATDFARYHAVVDAAVQAAIDLVRPGISVWEVDQAARSVMREADVEDAFLHSLGHGIGLEIHEGPRISSAGTQQSSLRLRPGMVVTIEPGLYFADRFGIRLEEDLLVTDDGSRLLTSLPRGIADLSAML